MFAKSITDSDDFLDLPLDVQLLYFHLGMQADDEGFLNSTRKIVRMLGVEPDALQILCDMGFLIPFPSGVVAIRHWHVNNKIRKDRYSGTQFVAEREQLEQEYKDIQTELSPLHADAKKLWAIHYNIYEVQHEQERQNTAMRQKKQEMER